MKCEIAMSSFEKINYNLRPNKCIERKMLCEALGRLSFLESMHKYQYIGFGSAYFADFSLFHKNLGITKLISIEAEEAKKLRFEFNIPYAGIEMKYGHSSTVLPNLELEKQKNIVWLDYDDRVSDYMFSDIDTFFSNAMPGSTFILSVNVEEELMKLGTDEKEFKMTQKEFKLSALIERIGKARIPNEFMDLNFNTKNMIGVVYEMFSRQIATSLNTRNGENEGQIKYRQLFNFTYSDSSTILTIGGVIFDKSQEAKIKEMDFENLPFIRSDSEPYRIQSPNLTFREIKALDKALPDGLEIERGGRFKNKKLQAIPLIPTDIRNYASIYRYYPHFTEATL
jgi:hypothetical protein